MSTASECGRAGLDAPYYGGWTPPAALEMPPTLAEWEHLRARHREALARALGDLPPTPERPAVRATAESRHTGYLLRRLEWDNGAGATVPAYLVVPDRLSAPAPGILFHHWHGGQYALGKDQVLAPWPPGGSFAEAAAARGWVVLAIDSYAFGERRSQGPAGAREEGHAAETSLFKMFLWQGRTLWGMMVRDDRIALDVLCSQPEVDSGRIGALGASMGSTRTWWLAALDERVRVSVCTVCLTRYAELIAQGLLAEHGIYYYVPGFLREFDTEGVVSLIAPRPLLTLSGEDDSGSPVAGVRKINSFCERIYGLHGRGERFRGITYPGVGHQYTPEMWRETFDWLVRWLA